VSLRIASGLAVLATVAVPGAVGAPAPQSGPTATAKALAVRIVLPNGTVVGSTPVLTGSATAPSFAYPATGAVITTGAIHASSKTTLAKTATSTASSSAANFSLFDGDITADSVSTSATAAARGGHAGGAFAGTKIAGLQALGRPHAFGRATLADWGRLIIGSHTVVRSAPTSQKGYAGVSIALDVLLTKAHGGLPAGAQVQVGYVQVTATTAPPVVPNTGPHPGDRPQLLPPTTEPLVGVPQVITPPLTAAPYVYPVFGSSDYVDQYGTATLGNGWQRGIDIFGRLGQPLVAVSAGTLYSVGWNHLAGNRLWLRDHEGNEFLYSHLAAFSNLAENGAHVRAGQVIGFMGDTGNSGGKPTHLHFEIYPVSMLFLGSDGAVDPGTYLVSWHHVASLPFPVGTGWAPRVPGTISAPEPGAMLITGSDISTADGLDPASLRRAVSPHG
jgi:murein DD-endopeptidase MepM/ murein hydrolase activator NlpD